MTDVFVVRNQLGHYWGKAKTWVDGSNPRTVMRTGHEDEAINTLFELSSRDIELRGEVIATRLSERNDPIVEPSEIPLPEEPEQEEEANVATPELNCAQEDGADPSTHA